MTITVLAGGVGAAKFLSGLTAVTDPASVTAVVNVADDCVLHGLRVSPDIDTVTYTLAGEVNPDTGWGLEGETWRTMDRLGVLGGATWFRLGDTDLATHLYRTQRLNEGANLTDVTAEVAKAMGVATRILPVTNDDVRTRVTVAEPATLPDGTPVAAGTNVAFQDWFVGMRHTPQVSRVDITGADTASVAPGVLDAIGDADMVVIAPSNPVVSINPLLAVSGVRATVQARRDNVVAVSPIVGGKALKGPADRLMASLGIPPSVVGVAGLYAPLAATLVIDTTDADFAPDVEQAGMRCVVAPTVMRDPPHAQALATTVLKAR